MEDGNLLSMGRERSQVMVCNMKRRNLFTKVHSNKAKEMDWVYSKYITVQGK